MFFELFLKAFKDEANFRLTLRGNNKLVYKGYEYNYYKWSSSNDITYWRCSKSRWSQCKGKAQTRLVNGKQMVKAYDEHNHPTESK